MKHDAFSITRQCELLGLARSTCYYQPIGEAGLLDVDILLQRIELGAERHLLLPEVLERDAQQIAQLDEHPVRGVDVAVHQRRDRVQRVEQEVRVQLLLQRLELRRNQLGLELRGADLALARLAVVEQRVTEADDGPVGHHFPVEVEDACPLDLRPPVVVLA